MRGWAFTATAVCALSLAFPLQASPKDELEKAQQDIEQSKLRQSELESQQKALEGELAEFQKRLVISAEAVQKAELDVQAGEERLRIVEEQLKLKNTMLVEQRKHLSALIQAALRLNRMPPEAMLVMPDDVQESMKAGRALKMTSDSIREEMTGLALQVKELDQLEQKMSARRLELLSRKEALGEERAALEAQLEQRKSMQDNLNRQQREEAKKTAQLAKKAEDLQGLVGKLRQQERASKEQEARRSKRSFARAKGDLRKPVAGKEVQRFGASQGAEGKGIVYQAGRNAQVVAPFEGEVVFAGSFLNYGRMVILRHSDDFHTLLAGLATIDTSVGEFLLEGEPIGAMGDGKADNRLYVELRKDNQPIDPGPWIKNQ